MTDFAIITGGARNIGAAIAKRLAGDGPSIIVSDRLKWQPKLDIPHLQQ